MSHFFLSNERVYSGEGALGALGNEARRFGKKALVVTGKSAMRKAGFTRKLCDLLGSASIESVLFEEVETNPSLDTCDRARVILKEESCDLVVGLGGGSALDAAKLMAGLAREPESSVEFFYGRAKRTNPSIPFIAIATTSGTGAEATINSVVTDTATGTKRSIRYPDFMAKVAIIDPALTVTAPPFITAAAGMDALTQAIESYVSIKAFPLTEACSVRAFRLIGGSLKRAYDDGSDMAARTDMSYASYLAGLALNNAGLGVVHGIAHPFTSIYGIPHGLACAMLLPHVLEFNRETIGKKYDNISHLLDKDAIEFVNELLSYMKLDRAYADNKIDDKHFDVFLKEGMLSGSTKANPRKVSEQDIVNMLTKLL